MRLAFAVLASCWTVNSQAPAHQATPARGPNIVLIHADDLGYAELGCYGQRLIKTPNIDRLASQGMRFTDYYCGAPVCAPSRCVLMTGKHPGHAYIRNNSEVRPEGQRPIPAEEVTIGEMLRQAGYATAAIGKWGLGPVGSPGDPLRQGFDLFFGYNCQRHAHSYYPSYLWHNDRRVPLNNHPPVPGHARLPKGADPHDPASYAPFKGQDYAPDRMIDMALRFIREQRDGPFFLYYPTPIPHVALHVPDDDLKPYLGQWDETPFTGNGYTPHQTPRAAYAAMITRMDTNVGRILKLLAELQLEDNTIVMFTSDNGTTHLKREVDYDFFRSVGPLRGLKGSVYEGGIRVPMIVRYPGRVAAGSETDWQATHWDAMATLAELVGAAPPPGTDGVSYLPTLLGEDERQTQRQFLYWEFTGYGGQQAVRMGKWKAVRQQMLRKSNPNPLKTELYDLSQDIGEQNDLAAAHPEVVARIERIMRAEHVDSPLFRFPPIDRQQSP